MGKKRKKTKKTRSEKMEYEISSGDLFKDFGYANPEEAKAKWDLAFLVRLIVEERNLTQQQAARLIGIDQPKVSKIMRGLLSEFTIERLMKYLLLLGFDIEIKASKSKTLQSTLHVKSNNLKRINT